MIRKPLSFAGLAGAAVLALPLLAFDAAPVSANALLITETANSEDDLLFAGPENNNATDLESGATHVNGLITASPNPFPDPFTEIATSNPTNPDSELALVQSLVGEPISFANGTGDASKIEAGPDLPGSTETDPGQFDGPNSVTNFDPGFSWVYAFVKPDGFWTIYENTGAGTLTTHLFDHGISHITFFVPLPAAAWLMLTALAGLFGWRRWTGAARGTEPVAA